jgi:hypothetical protein
MKKVIVTSGWGASYLEGGGCQWLNLHYLAGLRALGVEGYWLDITQKTDEKLIRQFRSQCGRFGFGDQCIVLRDDQQIFGMNELELAALCGDCDLLINLCGALQQDELLQRIRRRAYFDLDPGFTQAWAHQFDMHFDKHNLFFTVGLNVGGPGFPIPVQGIHWQPFSPPVALEYWPVQTEAPTRPFTTVAQWRGQEVVWQGEYCGPKREEFLRFIDLPGQTTQPLELALLIHESETDDLATLRNAGWRLVSPHETAGGLEGFRRYIQQSRGEFSVAKSGYVKTRGGWFSDRTVCYLASGRPVLVQDTGIGRYLPTGRGLLTFATMEEAVAGIEAINSDYAGHCVAARRLAEEQLAAPKVLQSILERAGVL